ncbi:nucleotidyltransferase domain-containing protein [soil metagenome]
MRDALERRRVERADRLATATRYVRALSKRVELLDAVVIGSTARGDFNVWSDIDVVVVAQDLPERAPDRALLLAQDARGGVQAVGFTPDEFGAALRKGNPMAREALASGERVLESGRLLLDRDGFGSP